MKDGFVTIDTPDGAMEAFQVIPPGEAPLPALVIAHEALGVNSHIQDVCRRFAGEGYAAIAPDFYHRSGRLLAYSYDDPKRREPFSALTNEGIEADVNAAFSYLNGQEHIDRGRIGIIGFCLGGFIAFLAACRVDERPSYNAEAAREAWTRTVQWLELRVKALQSYPTED